jgi:hypothetical protein
LQARPIVDLLDILLIEVFLVSFLLPLIATHLSSIAINLQKQHAGEGLFSVMRSSDEAELVLIRTFILEEASVTCMREGIHLVRKE